MTFQSLSFTADSDEGAFSPVLVIPPDVALELARVPEPAGIVAPSITEAADQ